MLHFRKLLLPLISARPLPTPTARLLFSTTASTSLEPFAVEEYLVATCGLTRAQALKASKKLSHIKSPTKPDTVLSFLSALGLSRPDIAALVAADPLFLCANVEKTLAPRVTELGDLGLSRFQIAQLVPLARTCFRSSSLGPNLGFWLPVIGSFEKVLKALKLNSNILGSDIEKVVKPNLALLQQYGIHMCNFLHTFMPMVVTRPPKHVQDAVACISKLGVRQDSPMFSNALMVFAVQSQEKVDEKIRTLEMLGWLQDDVLIAVRKMPSLLNMSMERLRRNLDFLTRDVRLEIPYIAQRPVLVMYSLERRLIPRHRLLEILNSKGLLDAKFDFYSVAALSEKKFLDRFLRPYKHIVPDLAAAYTSSCGGKVQH
ncbi:transcription termination factor MTEF1, chloroplastic-like [Phragmites australis]|uniref:transcription termination factor MTEF1, chloroplastic-like n=1 Tax=Phragmites australis TaxID=29695 RepID=UPI002D768597|nr:transcription termination factor MTEF1, chloroplastic-like [Phragmites australis]XP_062228491.1 transcription termination factor MTEF1, chloroplastic-like [Phragmites australis]XP_062228493.1 transcription termination factor MTEF1, chloroplastic-like [Phragmites australis]XP_062228494.1 transcription termination factor MTEF1, chloroplastic-like [Phragmites australis]